MKLELLFTLILMSSSTFAGMPELVHERSEDILIQEIASWLDTEDFLNADSKHKHEYFKEIYSGKLKNSVTHIGEFELTTAYSFDTETKDGVKTEFLKITVLRPLVPGNAWRGWVDLRINLSTNEIAYEIPKNYADVSNFIDALSKRKDTIEVSQIKKHGLTDCKHKNYKKYTIYGYDVDLSRLRVIGTQSDISNKVEFRIQYERPLQLKHGNKSCEVKGIKAEDLDQIFLK